MMKIAFLLLLTIVVTARAQLTKKPTCTEVPLPRYAQADCTRANTRGSWCTYSCETGWKQSKGTSNRIKCTCGKRKCKWRAGKVPFACEIVTRAPIAVTKAKKPTVAAKECKMPNFQRASFGIMEISPKGAFMRVTVRPTKQTTGGWSVVLVFSKPFPRTAVFGSGHAVVTKTNNDRVLMLTGQDHVNDISMYGAFSFYIQVTGLNNVNPAGLTGLAGFYEEHVADASCILEPNVVRPLPTTTKAPTTPPKVVPTTRPTVTTRKTTPRVTTKRTTTKRTTTKRTNPPMVKENCEVLSNEGDKPGFIILNPGWDDAGSYVFTARAQKFGEQGSMDDWTIKMEFSAPIDSIEAYVADPVGPFMGGRVWLLKPKSFNKLHQSTLQILIIPKSTSITSAPTAVVTFCHSGTQPDENVTINPTTATTTTTTAATTTTASTVAKKTTTREAVTTGRCAALSPFSRLPPQSRPSTVNRYKPSRQTRTTKYDYNKVLHLSLIFYEAQRAGKLPVSNRIGFRGDSGLKDGCGVGLDLTKGYYDAGDNVKFGFPMAYTVTTVAWSLIEFGPAYRDAREFENGLAMIKWATDYFVAAHPSKDTLYVQVADAGVDHSKWQRPEDDTTMRRVYKIDANNPGSDVAAETSAALAAASILFRTEDPDYADLMLRHAVELYEFANTHRGAYHDSVPGVASYYKSWSGYNDELLWSLAWLYKATGDDKYLNDLKSNYNSMGGGNTAGEFSWDNKYPGVQVLLADFTGSRKYRDDVQRFMTSAMNMGTTPKGLTWKIKWGPNRYAANFAAIATFAAKLEPAMPQKQDYLDYAKKQINYMLGDNERESSYVIGFGHNPPQRAHHRASSCPSWTRLPVAKCGFSSLNMKGPNPHILYGALVGGPDKSGRYTDDRKDYIANEVATDYNAGFQSAVAGLQYFALEG